MSRTPFVLLLLCLAACGPSAIAPAQAPKSDAAAQTAAGRWDAFVDGYIDRYLAERPTFAVMQGRHEYDGKVADVSRPAIEQRLARLEREKAEAESFATAGLDPRRSFERDY